MRTLVAGLMVAALLTPAANAWAADAVTAPPAAPAATQEPPLYIWSGPYAGAFLGYNWSDFDGTGTANGINGGGFAGYNWQAGKYVFGLEGDIGYSGSDFTDGLTVKEGTFGSLRGRVGIDLNPFMLYATGGLAAAEGKVSNGSSSDTNAHIGWTAGAGAEAAVADNVTARIEYRYSDYGSKTYDLNTGPISKGFDEQSVRAGIGIKF
ncbi:MAG: outer membrane protein [Pararhizobium sp.]